ncbi:MAG TPA: alpha-glucan family phosphorylase [Candidatus Rifleibacterium sp.]|nr:alpha-glucan family phosphorylase [Candidatus Rifleibacterium sp.]HPT45343.1 alpha-glucan family phosphorylase [Candidatus Rifleibacterium sp.]
MKPIRTFIVVPSLPEPLAPLKDLAYNLWWCWNPEAIALWRRLDPVQWEATYHNPVKMLGAISQERLEAKARDEAFLANLHRVYESFNQYLNDHQTWYAKNHGGFMDKPVVAYYSAEFGLTESVRLYSGGLGMLAGDHLKSASDLGIPLVAVGLMYRVGYFQQKLNAGGYQQEVYPENDFHNMPVVPINDENGNHMKITVQLPGRTLFCLLWKLQVGRVPLYLLDTDSPENSAGDRWITRELYGGDTETRIMQELVLGIGGLRALHALDLHPCVYHMNEGHSAFLALERIAVAMERHQMTFREALELTRSGNVFTTHTPVPAGIDVFSRDLMDKYFSQYYSKLGISWQEFLDLGWQAATPKGDGFSMAVCALNLCGEANGVSKLHGDVSRKMWGNLYPDVPFQEIPIKSITNGVHTRSYASQEMSALFDRYLGPRWVMNPGDQTVWEKIDMIPMEELWRTHERRRERLVAFARSRLEKQLKARNAPPSEIARAQEVLNPEYLTIGFARRFATYKRATLLFKDKERLIRILTNKDRPIQIIVAGKAHPKDEPGKNYIKDIVKESNDERLRRHIVFIEDYDVVVARYLVQGVDVWLNNPRRPQEASGTSGMKAAVNGVLNLSILDGWWDEAYTPGIGWAIGTREEFENTDYQDEVEANSLYELLEKEVAPTFYDHSSDNLPRHWITMMKQCMKEINPVFNTNRMVAEYAERFYVPADRRYRDLSANDRQRARQLASWLDNVRASWANIRIEEIDANGSNAHRVGEVLDVRVKVHLANLKAADVLVQAFYGKLVSDGDLSQGDIVDLQLIKQTGSTAEFKGGIALGSSGKMGLAIRVMPAHPDLVHPLLTGHILWAR